MHSHCFCLLSTQFLPAARNMWALNARQLTSIPRYASGGPLTAQGLSVLQ